MTAPRLLVADHGRWLKPALGLLVTLAFLWLIAQQVDAAALAGAFAGLAPAWLLLALALLAADYALRILRWWWMLRALAPTQPAWDCAWPYFASIAVNNELPFRAGDVLRVFGSGAGPCTTLHCSFTETSGRCPPVKRFPYNSTTFGRAGGSSCWRSFMESAIPLSSSAGAHGVLP
jgi:hypothetical protein